MKEIPLSQGKVALVDDADYDWLNQWKWNAHRNGKRWYAERNEGRIPFRRIVHMHRLILDAPKGTEVDHVDGDGLNNTRANLRLATKAQNQHNRSMYHNNKTGYKGVSLRKKGRGWRAHIRVNGHLVHLGTFDTAEGAARAYDKSARELHGEFARPNFPD